MAKISGQITSVGLNAIENLGRGLAKKTKEYDVFMERQMNVATNMVWRIAHQKRPMMPKSVERKGRLTKMGNISYKRVSDPNASLGVPVDTGRLQSAIKKEVTRSGYGKFTGAVWVDTAIAPYGKDMEYGTSKVHARPFMRPAAAIISTQIKKLFNLSATMK
jgi:HK97 gp10 family phage protein